MIFILFPAKLFAISFHCVSTGPNGEVTTTWDNVGTSGVNFRAWHIHYSDGILPFILIDSVTTYAITNYTDVNANAISNQAYYFITFESNNGSPNIISDTIRAINLNLNNLSGFANLSWNQSRNPLVSTNFSHYVIYRMFTGGAFIAIDSIDASIAPNPMLYNDIITICDDTIKYMIEVRDSSGCISRSAIKADRFADARVPAIPVLDSVSVDLSGNATITWQVSTSSDTRSYVILQNPGPVPVDTVIGFSSVTLNSTISAQNGSVSFIVIAVDSCNNPSGQSLPHTSIFLNVGFNLCTQATQLSWSPYNFWGASPHGEQRSALLGKREAQLGEYGLHVIALPGSQREAGVDGHGGFALRCVEPETHLQVGPRAIAPKSLTKELQAHVSGTRCPMRHEGVGF